MTTPALPVAAGTDRMLLIETFVRIVEAGSLSAAAAQMGGTQPTVSRRLQLLERTMGVRLLKRSTHAIRLTEDGQRCYERGKELLATFQSFESEVRGAGDAIGMHGQRVPQMRVIEGYGSVSAGFNGGRVILHTTRTW